MYVHDNGNFSKREAIFFFALPLLSPIIQLWSDLHLDKDLLSLIVSAASISAGLLLNLLVLLYTVLEPKAEHAETSTQVLERRLIKETFYNISFAILVCAILVATCLLRGMNHSWLNSSSEAVIYYFGVQVFISLAQILKRFHKLLQCKIDPHASLSGQDQSKGMSKIAAVPLPETFSR